jgi:hypothetical protein
MRTGRDRGLGYEISNVKSNSIQHYIAQHNNNNTTNLGIRDTFHLAAEF